MVGGEEEMRGLIEEENCKFGLKLPSYAEMRPSLCSQKKFLSLFLLRLRGFIRGSCNGGDSPAAAWKWRTSKRRRFKVGVKGFALNI